MTWYGTVSESMFSFLRPKAARANRRGPAEASMARRPCCAVHPMRRRILGSVLVGTSLGRSSMSGAEKLEVTLEPGGERFVASGRAAPDDGQGRSILGDHPHWPLARQSLRAQPLQEFDGDFRPSG